MNNRQVDQLAKEMTELCKAYANKTAVVATSPLGKAMIGMVLAVLLKVVTPDQFHWWKPPA